MRMDRCVLATVFLLFAAEANNAQTTDPQLAEDRRILQAARLPTDGPELLTIFRRFIPSEAEQKRLETLVRQLGDDCYRVREQATTALIQAGPMALAALTAAQKDAGLEESRRAARCISAIEATSWLDVGAAATRLVHQQRPTGGSEALLAFLPYATDAILIDEVFDALDHLGVPDEQTSALFAQAATQALPIQRAAAAFVLGHHGSMQQRSVVRQMQADADSHVRLRAAQGLLLAGDSTAVETLIALLRAEGDIARRAEDALVQLGDRDAPDLALALDKDMRQQTHDAWLAWWRGRGDSVDVAKAMAQIDFTPLGRARDLSRRLLLAMVAGDVGEVKQVIDVPFNVSDTALTKWNDAEQFFHQALDEFRRTNAKMKFRVLDVVSVDEYLKTVREGTAAFNSLPKQAIRVVYVRGQFGTAREETGAILVRVTGSHPRVVGIGPGFEQGTQSAAR